MQSKLARWKSKCLSLAGRATLVKAVYSAIPSYTMQCNFLPISVSNQLDKLSRDLLWGSTSEKRKIHAVKWENVTKPKNLGGLGIRDNTTMNTVAMAKLNWRLQNEDNSLWARILKGKYKSTNQIGRAHV